MALDEEEAKPIIPKPPCPLHDEEEILK